MVIAIEYKSGRIKEFDSTAFTTSNAMSAGDKKARNVMTELDLRLDLVDEVGLRLDFYWYDATPDGPKVEVKGLTDSTGEPVKLTSASRRLGTSVLLCSRAGIKRVSRIVITRANGSVDALWRQGSGDWLINGAKFEAQRVLTYTDSNVSSMNSQAVFVFKYIRKANPDMDDAEICELLGYPLEAFKEIRKDEAENGDEIGTPDADIADLEPSESSSSSPFEPDDGSEDEPVIDIFTAPDDGPEVLDDEDSWWTD